MAGLLDWLNTPQGIGLLSGVAGYAATARKGTPINNLGRGAITGLTGYQQAQDQIRQDAENKLAQQYRQMQMEQMTRDAENKRAMQSSLQALYKPAGTEPYKADNPFGEDLGNLQNETPATFGGKPVDPVMAAVLPYAQLDDILKLTQGQQKTSEMKNWEFAQGLTDDERAQFMGSNRQGSVPSAIQEFEYLKKLEEAGDKAGIQRFFEVKRATQWRDFGDRQAPILPGNVVGPATPNAMTPGQSLDARDRGRKLDYELPPQKPRGQKAFTVTDPDGGVHTFSNSMDAARFKRAIGGR